MKASSQLCRLLAIPVCLALASPAALRAQTQSAGQINRMIPDVNLQHGSRVQLAAAGSKVMWGDLVTTDRQGRARTPARPVSHVPDDDGSDVAFPVTGCAQAVRQRGRPNRPGLARSPTRSA